CRPGDDQEAEDEAGLAAGRRGGSRAERCTADHDANPGSAGQRAPPPWRAAGRGSPPVRFAARAGIAPARPGMRSAIWSGHAAVRRARVRIAASWLGHLLPDASRYGLITRSAGNLRLVFAAGRVS